MTTTGVAMSLHFQRNADGTTTGRNDETGFTATSADEDEVRRLVHEDAGWEHPPPTPPPTPTPPSAPGVHRFALVHEEFGGDFRDERYESLRTHPPSGCQPVDFGCFALQCERSGATLLGAVSDTVAEIRREHGVVMNSLGIEEPDEWSRNDPDGYGAQLVAQLLLTVAHRAALLGYGRKDLVRLLDAAGVR
ncbi:MULTISPECIES: hypothetical protein [unclassified Streptomyces]|uniref:hypothetical protein n=1 Tax=unclassified Streptomyces TaxID=2593676 RepID=UPI003317209D